MIEIGDSLGDEGTKAISEALKVNKTMTALNLCGLFSFHSFHSNAFVCFSGNNIGAEGAKALAAGLRANSGLKTISLSGLLSFSSFSLIIINFVI